MKLCRRHGKSGSQSKNMMFDFVPEIAKYPKVAPNSKIVQNSVQVYCLTLLSNEACLWHDWQSLAAV